MTITHNQISKHFPLKVYFFQLKITWDYVTFNSLVSLWQSSVKLDMVFKGRNAKFPLNDVSFYCVAYCSYPKITQLYLVCLQLHLHSGEQSRFAFPHLQLEQSRLQEHLNNSLHDRETSGIVIQIGNHVSETLFHA